MSLSERVRAGSEVAPWVCEEIAKLEAELAECQNREVGLRHTIEKQKRAIWALNSCIGGPGSTTTENIADVDTQSAGLPDLPDLPAPTQRGNLGISLFDDEQMHEYAKQYASLCTTRFASLFWQLVYADSALAYVAEHHPQVYYECGDKDEMPVRRALLSGTPMPEADPPVKLSPVDGDLLPPIGSQVLIHLNSTDSWVPHTVVGYYVWGPLKPYAESNLYRVFVRVINKDGILNARMLNDIHPIDGTKE